MEAAILPLVVSLLALILGGAGALYWKKTVDQKTRKTAELEAERILGRARSESTRIDRDAKTKAKDFETRARKNAEAEIQKQKQKFKADEQALIERQGKLEKEFQNKEAELQNRIAELTAREEKAKIQEKRLSELDSQASQQIQNLKEKLEAVARLSEADAKKELVSALTAEAEAEAGKKAAIIEERYRAESEKKARRIIAMAISRFAGEHSSEQTVSVIALPNEEMKGKIIGREGRNIRTLEAACGVDLIVDETPEAVVISGFDPVRREVARKALEKLMEDGRVHPSRIEEVIEKQKKELFKLMREDGEKAAFELGLPGLHPELIKVIGSLKFRQSAGQNIYAHSLEVGFLAGMMAAEIGVDVKKARRAGLLHDIGKALDHSIEGSHAVIGAEFAKRHGEAADICHAIRAHHDDEKPQDSLAFLVQAANAISNARPGARKGSMDSYVRRLQDMESIGNSFDGVVRTFAVQAGKELRVMVESSRVTDEQATMLSYDVARKIERELNYTGQVKVTVVRETRVVEYAR